MPEGSSQRRSSVDGRPSLERLSLGRSSLGRPSLGRTSLGRTSAEAGTEQVRQRMRNLEPILGRAPSWGGPAASTAEQPMMQPSSSQTHAPAGPLAAPTAAAGQDAAQPSSSGAQSGWSSSSLHVAAAEHHGMPGSWTQAFQADVRWPDRPQAWQPAPLAASTASSSVAARLPAPELADQAASPFLHRPTPAQTAGRQDSQTSTLLPEQPIDDGHMARGQQQPAADAQAQTPWQRLQHLAGSVGECLQQARARAWPGHEHDSSDVQAAASAAPIAGINMAASLPHWQPAAGDAILPSLACRACR